MASDQVKVETLAMVRVTSQQFAMTRLHRDTAIRVAREAGHSLRAIAKASDLSKDAVQAILDRT